VFVAQATDANRRGPGIDDVLLMEGMYFPEVFGRSDGGKFTVTGGE
jgi:hypothetical protein